MAMIINKSVWSAFTPPSAIYSNRSRIKAGSLMVNEINLVDVSNLLNNKHQQANLVTKRHKMQDERCKDAGSSDKSTSEEAGPRQHTHMLLVQSSRSWEPEVSSELKRKRFTGAVTGA
jgi:hypothetical protein